MNIKAYTYEADVHCIDCTAKWAHSESLRRGGYGWVRISEHNLIEYQVTYFNGLVYDITVAPNPLFNAENPTQDLACGDCHKLIDQYTVEGVTV
jgi:hypothetical protein